MKEFSYIIKRILQMIPVLLIITVIIFFGMRLIPGDPAVTMLGDHATPQALEEMRHKLGLDQSVIIQYFLFFKTSYHVGFREFNYIKCSGVAAVYSKSSCHFDINNCYRCIYTDYQFCFRIYRRHKQKQSGY